ncbi:cytochrome P450 [Streptomyces sp. GS7]|uniref:cytochrome P450 n=1 Tax=Streptomyces sp. GS7 TaxID=2692234 RepID=UPI001318AE94|nr:cytochrome P450 [Streptomyces sp. GS7]QHC27042.1 cytochrome P450 [Streptomyces sp. GS7]
MREAIPTAQGAVPFLGHLLSLVRDPLGFLTGLPEQGEIMRVRLGPAQAVMVCDAALTRQLLLQDSLFDKGGPLFERFRDVVGDGLPTCPHSMHRRQRRLTQPAFRPKRMEDYARTMTEQISTVTDTWRDGQRIDVLSEMLAITGRSLIATMYGNALTAPHLRQTLEDLVTVFTGVYRRMIVPRLLNRVPTPGNLRFSRAGARLRRTLGEIVTDRRAQEGAAETEDLLSALLAARDISEEHAVTARLSDTELSDQVVSLFLAGTETTATALAWALHLSAIHPHTGVRLRDEADQVLHGRHATYADLPHLPFTRQVITETLRLYPPAWLLTRTLAADTDLGGYALPAGTTVIYSPFVIHHRPDLFPRPERFDPDRWANGLPNPQDHQFIAFGAGARKCVGDQFALTEATLALATIVAQWHLEPLHQHRVRPALAASLRPRHLSMQASRRSHRPAL